MSGGWLEDTVALVTGGGSGLGRALVARFVEEGAKVGILERSPDKVAGLERDFGDAIVAVTGDVTRFDDNARAVEATCARFGRLDTFIPNAGVFDFFEPLAGMQGATLSTAFDELFAINVKGPLLGARAALPRLLATRGSIVVTLSPAGFYAAGGGVLYTASKHALVGLVKQLAHEFAPKVRVNGVAPGGMGTELGGLASTGTQARKLGEVVDFDIGAEARTPLGGVYRPEDYCGPYVLLASNRNARPITGTIINSDGGWAARGLRAMAGGYDL